MPPWFSYFTMKRPRLQTVLFSWLEKNTLVRVVVDLFVFYLAVIAGIVTAACVLKWRGFNPLCTCTQC